MMIRLTGASLCFMLALGILFSGCSRHEREPLDTAEIYEIREKLSNIGFIYICSIWKPHDAAYYIYAIPRQEAQNYILSGKEGIFINNFFSEPVRATVNDYAEENNIAPQVYEMRFLRVPVLSESPVEDVIGYYMCYLHNPYSPDPEQYKLLPLILLQDGRLIRPVKFQKNGNDIADLYAE